MTRYQYYNKLCNLESGEFIYRSVTNVDGYYVIRPRIMGASLYVGKEPNHNNAVTSEVLYTHRTAIEDPYGSQPSALHYGELFISPSKDKRYSFIEMPWIDIRTLPYPYYYFGLSGRTAELPTIRDHFYLSDPSDVNGKPGERKIRDVMIRRGGQGSFLRYERSETPIFDQTAIDLVAKNWDDKPSQKGRTPNSYYTHYPAIETRTNTLKSRYGVLWRGITRPQDRKTARWELAAAKSLCWICKLTKYWLYTAVLRWQPIVKIIK